MAAIVPVRKVRPTLPERSHVAIQRRLNLLSLVPQLIAAAVGCPTWTESRLRNPKLAY